MDVLLKGVRGNIPTATLDTSLYGGNTACLEVYTKDETRIILDAGTGLRDAWSNPPDSGEAHIFITHGHVDHLAGLWFFKPLHMPHWTTNLYLPAWLDNLPDFLHRVGFFPVPFEQLQGRVVFHLVQAGDRLAVGRAAVEAFAVRHPGGGLGYRVRDDHSVLVYTGDHEIEPGEAARNEAAEFLRGADLAVVDAQYNLADYRPGFGHAAWEDWLEAAARAGLGRLVLTHHDPARSDHELENLDRALQELKGQSGLDIQVGQEGQRLTLGAPKAALRRRPDRLFQFLEELSAYRDERVVLDRILAKAREITRADAGTIFLVEGDDLVLAYFHNDSLFTVDEAHRHAYYSLRLPIAKNNSIVSFVAATGQPLNLPDVRALPAGAAYRFNDSLDRRTGYATISLLALPFMDSGGRTLGVMQLVNSLDPLYRVPRPFSLDMERCGRVLVREVSGRLERSAVERNGIYGILRMAAVHDPFETCPHAERVGAIAAELYHAWAYRHGHPPDIVRHNKGGLRLAAMLHDIGKVGISDLILKKKGRLTPEEITVMRDHTRLGVSILSDDPGEISALARDIVLHHHQRWDGQGYAGSGDEGRLAGEAIPLEARITAIADVFDALVSRRYYKKPWTFAAALDYMRREAGGHFDPDLMASLEDIVELLHFIYERFPDKDIPAGERPEITRTRLKSIGELGSAGYWGRRPKTPQKILD
ncbi:MAG: HD domain-containing protein [Candidatus Adiutrix sp.]|jgi:phosphoribosyl 1,2-cyclic phosphodiesterase|nr:HD domain-containing protein [Candidatus Adiutrix sp.]